MSIRKTRFIRSLTQARLWHFDNANWEPPKVAGRDQNTALALIIPSKHAGSPGRRKVAAASQDREAGGVTFKHKHGVASSLPSSKPAGERKRALMGKWAK